MCDHLFLLKIQGKSRGKVWKFRKKNPNYNFDKKVKKLKMEAPGPFKKLTLNNDFRNINLKEDILKVLNKNFLNFRP